MSPEQCAGRPIDARSDLYSLGIILYEAVNGRKPFDTDDALSLLSHHLAVPPSPMESDVPPFMVNIISRLLEKDPVNRVQSAQELLGIFDAAAREIRDTELQSRASAPVVEPRSGQALRTFGAQVRRASIAGYAWAQARAKRRIHWKRIDVSLGLLTAIVGGLGLLGTLTLSHIGSKGNADISVASGANSAAVKLDSALPRASRGEFQQQVERIEMLKTYERGERDWILLARGYAELGQWLKCAQAYRSVLSLHPSLKSDPLLLSDLQLAAQDPEAFKVVLNLAESVLGIYGVDLIWQMWQQIRTVADQAESAEKLRKKLIVLSQRARPSLRVAIELDYYQTCPTLEGVIKRAAKAADNRSLGALELLKRTTGCGPRQEYDCAPCIRGEGLLEKAIERAKENSPPPLGGD